MFQQGLLVRSLWQALGWLEVREGGFLGFWRLPYCFSFILRLCLCWDLQRPLSLKR